MIENPPLVALVDLLRPESARRPGLEIRRREIRHAQGVEAQGLGRVTQARDRRTAAPARIDPPPRYSGPLARAFLHLLEHQLEAALLLLDAQLPGQITIVGARAGGRQGCAQDQ